MPICWEAAQKWVNYSTEIWTNSVNWTSEYQSCRLGQHLSLLSDAKISPLLNPCGRSYPKLLWIYHSYESASAANFRFISEVLNKQKQLIVGKLDKSTFFVLMNNEYLSKISKSMKTFNLSWIIDFSRTSWTDYAFTLTHICFRGWYWCFVSSISICYHFYYNFSSGGYEYCVYSGRLKSGAKRRVILCMVSKISPNRLTENEKPDNMDLKEHVITSEFLIKLWKIQRS